MDTPTIVNMVLAIMSFLLAVLSLVFVFLTLRQNSKMLEASSRPYVAIYIDSITICEQQSYFILKNSGQTPAEIIDFTYPKVLESTEQMSTLMQEQFSHVKGVTLAPGQSCLLPYAVSSLPDEYLKFNIKYKSQTKTYKESYSLHPRKYIHIPKSRPESDIPENDARHMHTLREMTERML